MNYNALCVRYVFFPYLVPACQDWGYTIRQIIQITPYMRRNLNDLSDGVGMETLYNGKDVFHAILI
jgi:hypothetical protein